MSEFRGRYFENLVVTRFLEQYDGKLPQTTEELNVEKLGDVDWDFLEDQFSENKPQGV